VVEERKRERDVNDCRQVKLTSSSKQCFGSGSRPKKNGFGFRQKNESGSRIWNPLLLSGSGYLAEKLAIRIRNTGSKND